MISRCLAVAAICVLCPFVRGEQPVQSWQDEVRKCAEAHDWSAAMRVIDHAAELAPQDTDVVAWRARVLTWSGNLSQAELEYQKLLQTAPHDPDTWAGMATVYSRTGRNGQALQALDRALQLDPKRADLHLSFASALRRAGRNKEARAEFQKAIDLDPTNAEARAGLLSVREEPKHELVFGFNNDLFNFAGPNHDEQLSLASRWTPGWQTVFAEGSYQRSGINGTRVLASVARISPRLGAITLGGAAGHDNGVIPRGEAFFDYDRGWRTASRGPVRGLEIVYHQHWYWYSTAQILTLNQTAIVYLPREWTWSLRLTEARSDFPGTTAEWRPSGMTKLAFPLAARGQRQLNGNVLFATGTEDFAEIDQIGRFSSQTYGGGLGFKFSRLQEIGGFAGYQKRTQDRSDISFGFTYAIHF